MKKNNIVANDELTTSKSIIDDLKKNLKKEKTELARMKKRGVDNEVIEVQENIVNRLIKDLEHQRELDIVSKAKLINIIMTFSIVNEETSKRTDGQKKIALVHHNRDLDLKKVDNFIALIDNDKYDNAYPIIVVEAVKLVEVGYKVENINGEELTLEEAEGYFAILDGQHRSVAFAKLNAAGKEYPIPNVYIRDIQNVGEYLTNINMIGSSWDRKDKLMVVALITKNELFTSIANLIKEGFNASAAGLIYTGKAISDKVLNKALKGEEYQLPKSAVINIERGNKFITLCKAASISTTYITKRYFIKDFNNFAASVGEEKAFEALSKLKELKLDEKQLKAIKEEGDFIVILRKATQF